jgi:hypothetical protein
VCADTADESLNTPAPTQSELSFAITQAIVLAIFVLIGTVASICFQPEFPIEYK